MNYQKITLILISFLCWGQVCAHVQLNNPKAGDVYAPGENIIIQWAESVDHGDSDWDLYFSSDGGYNWTTIQKDIAKSVMQYSWYLPNDETNTAMIKVVQDNKDYDIFEGLSGNFRITSDPDPVDPVITSIDLQGVAEQKDHALIIYPNPASSYAVFQCTLSEPAVVTLGIYNMSGSLVYGEKYGMMSQGTHVITWTTNKCTSGIFIGRVLLGDMAVHEKFIVTH